MIELAIFDMAGTTVRDRGEIETCFQAAAKANGIETNSERIMAMMGWSKRTVFERLLADQIGENSPHYVTRVEEAYQSFRKLLESHYITQPVEPTDGCLEIFEWLRAEEIPIVLTTGFYRHVTNIILRRLGWDHGLDSNYVGSDDSPFALPSRATKFQKDAPTLT
jgi:phosphoglycolate phosphatase-like HAD superfamily hydrolase